MEIVSYSSSKGAISVGVNFNPMYRHRIFKYRPLKEFCVSKLKEAAQIHGQKCQFKLDEVGLDIDHAHVLVTFGPNTKLSDIIKKLKQHSAKELFKAFPEEEKLRGKLVILEKDGFCVGATFSVSILNPRPLKRPEIRARTPNLFSTRIEIVCLCSMVNASMTSSIQA